MTLTPAQVKTAVIIGKYGGCLPACDNGAMITGWFNLAGCRVNVAVVRGGGTIPMAPGEIQNFYTPVDDAGEWWVRIDDLDPFKKPKRLVKVEVEFKDKKTEKVYLVSERTSTMMVNIANLINRFDELIRPKITKFAQVTTRTVVTIKNFIMRRNQ